MNVYLYVAHSFRTALLAVQTFGVSYRKIKRANSESFVAIDKLGKPYCTKVSVLQMFPLIWWLALFHVCNILKNRPFLFNDLSELNSAKLHHKTWQNSLQKNALLPCNAKNWHGTFLYTHDSTMMTRVDIWTLRSFFAYRAVSRYFLSILPYLVISTPGTTKSRRLSSL